MLNRFLRLSFLLVLVFIPALSHAQLKLSEMGVFAGVANYKGDIAPDIVLSTTGPSFGLLVKKNFSQMFSLGLHGTYGRIAGADSNTASLAARNLSFVSDVWELSLQGEFNFLRFGTGPRDKRYTPYIFTGVGVFKFAPKAWHNETWVYLQPLVTEGQGLEEDNSESVAKPYSLYSISIPIGGGFKFRIAERLNLQVQAGFRGTFTDYLDDVSTTYPNMGLLQDARGNLAVELSDRSGERTGQNLGVEGFQRGNPDNKDWYVFSGFSLVYLIDKHFCPTF